MEPEIVSTSEASTSEVRASETSTHSRRLQNDVGGVSADKATEMGASLNATWLEFFRSDITTSWRTGSGHMTPSRDDPGERKRMIEMWDGIQDSSEGENDQDHSEVTNDQHNRREPWLISCCSSFWCCNDTRRDRATGVKTSSQLLFELQERSDKEKLLRESKGKMPMKMESDSIGTKPPESGGTRTPSSSTAVVS